MTRAATGKDPWRWLFIIEGVMGICIGIFVMMMLPRFPDKMKKGKHWLFTSQEIELAIQRVSGKSPF
jgi:MFS family permease